MDTSSELNSVKEQLDTLLKRLNTHSLPATERTKLLRQMRVLLAKMDMLASSALGEHKQQTVQFPWSLS
jgi:hypothetical protein